MEHIGSHSGAGEMTPWLRALAALTEEQDEVSSIHRRWLTTAGNFSSRGSDAPFCLLGHLYTRGAQTHTWAQTPEILNKQTFKYAYPKVGRPLELQFRAD